MSLVVRRVQCPAEFRQFLKLPSIVYGEDPFWIPQLTNEVRRSLDAARNPYYTEASLGVFLAYRDGSPVSRVTAVVNHRYGRAGAGTPALFGFFESTDDPAAVSALFRSVGAWSAAKGATSLHGPFHPHHYSEIGLQISGFDSLPSFFQTHHPAYYERLLTAAGFSRERVLHTRRNAAIRPYVERKRKIFAGENGLRMRTIDPGDLPNDLERIRIVFNDAFSGNCYFLPLSREEYLYSARSLMHITRPDLNIIVEHGKEPVGVLQCVLDVNPLIAPARSGRMMPWDMGRYLIGRRKVRRLIVFAVGIRKRWQRSRVYALLCNALTDMAMNFDELETTWMSPDNPVALNAAERFGMVPDKEFAMYSRPVLTPTDGAL